MLRVLLLEDSPLDETILAAQLRAGGLTSELRRVEAREPFRQALEGWRPDVVLSDYNVPGFGGEEALAITRELLKRGATDYVLKDRLERLVPSMQRALREAREKAERLEAERKLTERERTLSTLMSNLPGMVFRSRKDKPWFLEFASEGCLALTGYEPETFYPGGIDFESIMHPDDVERVGAEAAAAFQRSEPLTTTYRIRTRQGEERWVWARAVPVPGQSDEAACMEGFVTDITPQKKAEAEVLRRVEFEQQLIGIVSHDLKNPLNAIMLGANALLELDTMDEVSAKLTRRIVASTERAARMIDDLLDFTQIRLGMGLPVTPRDLDLGELVAQVLDEFEQSHPGRRVIFEGPRALAASVDPGRVSQALTNLVQNALAYSPPDIPVSVRLDEQGGDAVIEVHNGGEPIPADMMAAIFQPMRRAATSSDARSIGLGLFIVESIARAHGGTVTVRSTVEDGTTFALRLPNATEHPAP